MEGERVQLTGRGCEAGTQQSSLGGGCAISRGVGRRERRAWISGSRDPVCRHPRVAPAQCLSTIPEFHVAPGTVRCYRHCQLGFHKSSIDVLSLPEDGTTVVQARVAAASEGRRLRSAAAARAAWKGTHPWRQQWRRRRWWPWWPWWAVAAAAAAVVAVAVAEVDGRGTAAASYCLPCVSSAATGLQPPPAQLTWMMQDGRCLSHVQRGDGAALDREAPRCRA